MNATFVAKASSFRVAIFLFLLLASIYSGLSMGGESSTEEKTPYKVPAEKARKWEDLKNIARNDHNVCLEHCGYELSCLDRCETVYNNRLDREYNLLLNEIKPDSDK